MFIESYIRYSSFKQCFVHEDQKYAQAYKRTSIIKPIATSPGRTPL